VTREIAPWAVWWADFDPQVGREQADLRPAIVVGTFACQLPNQLAFVVPCTTTDRQLPNHPQVTFLERPTFGCGLPVPVGQNDQLLAAVRTDPDHHQQAQLLLSNRTFTLPDGAIRTAILQT
jgi:mRNA interferase MazF